MATAATLLGNPCDVCAKRDDKKPMVFRGERWCSDDHRKVIQGEKAPELAVSSM